jgi:glycosyltransferase involved in cell wall biosynthesis
VWDHQAAQRPDHLIANSEHTKRRIAKYYRRDAAVIYPPIERELSKIKQAKKEHFLIISRLSEYKNIALAIETFNKMQLPLVIVGEGRAHDQLKRMAGDTVKIMGWVSEQEKRTLLARTRALVMPSEEDLGIVCVEALQANIPVIALGRGGACEIVENGVTGEFFDAPTVEMVADALRRFLEKEGTYDIQRMQEVNARFSRKLFREKLLSFIKTVTHHE